jgi:enoyl-CoA hydratase/carnithine racemase
MVVAFNQPKCMNTLTVAMGEEFQALMHSLEHNQEVKALVFTGAGKTFSAGADTPLLQQCAQSTALANSLAMSSFYRRYLSMRKVPVPTIAAINGPTVGIGAAFITACDYRIAASTATVGFVFTKIDAHPGLGSSFYLPKLVGPAVATKLLLTGETVTAAQAHQMGLVNEVVENGDRDHAGEAVVNRAVEIAGDFVAKDCLASRMLLRTMREDVDRGLDRALLREADAQSLCYTDALYRDIVKNMVETKTK